MIAFGGTFSATEPFNQLEQVLTDVDVGESELKWDGKNLGTVHNGFYSAVYPFITPLIDLVKYTMPELKTVTITGHSLGAAEALVFGAMLATDQPDLDVYIYTYGTPRVGGPNFVKALNDSGAEVIRFVNEIDLVTMVPTSVGLGDSVLHAGRQVTFNTTGVSEDCKDYFVGNQYASVLSSPLAALSGCPQEAAGDHTSYKDNIGRWLIDHGWTGNDVSPSCPDGTF